MTFLVKKIILSHIHLYGVNAVIIYIWYIDIVGNEWRVKINPNLCKKKNKTNLYQRNFQTFDTLSNS